MPQSNSRPPEIRQLQRTFQKESRRLVADHFQSLARQRAAFDADAREGAAIASAALSRQLERDEEYRATIGPLLERARADLTDVEVTDDVAIGSPLTREVALGLLSGSGIRDLAGAPGSIMLMTMAKDTRVDVRVPPYNDAWTATEGRHQQQQVWANKNDGRFGLVYTIGQEGGSIWSGAGVEVLFMRDHPGSPPGQGPAGLAQVRSHTPYRFAWHDSSYAGVAHQHAGFGVFVWSAPLDGGPSRTDLDHQRWRWHDGTSWYQAHSSPGFPAPDRDTALNFADEAPYFPIEPGRVYGAWIWCFAGGDTSGADLLSAAYAQAFIDATARFVVIGQQ